MAPFSSAFSANSLLILASSDSSSREQTAELQLLCLLILASSDSSSLIRLASLASRPAQLLS